MVIEYLGSKVGSFLPIIVICSIIGAISVIVYNNTRNSKKTGAMFCEHCGKLNNYQKYNVNWIKQ